MDYRDIHTFVICAYGNSSYLEDCMLSLVNQHNQSSIILYTSTPSLQIEDLCKKYNIVYHHGNGGSIGKDWNNALSCVKTRYATIAHQDDYYEPQYSELIIKKFQSNPDDLIAYSDYFKEKLKGNLDWIAWYQIGKMKGSFVYIDKTLMCHRIHEESETSKTISNNTRSQEDLETLELFWPKWMAKLLIRQYVKSQNSNN